MSFLHRLFSRLSARRRPVAASAPSPTHAPVPDGQGVAVRERFVQCASPAGLHRMHYLEWGDPTNPRVVVCVHGLTRNARDFDTLARTLAATHRVICPDVVGRGCSDWLRDKALYGIPQYVADMVTLIARLDAEQVDWVGTSMGGLIGMTLASFEGNPIRRMVLNDVGPMLPAAALNRIGSYVGKVLRFASLADAEAHIRSVHVPFGPHSDEEWSHLTRHSLRPDSEGALGSYVFQYDPGIGDSFRRGPVLMDLNLWSFYDRITCPLLVLRGADSDLLTADTVQAMTQRGPRAQAVEFAGIGHAPTLMHGDQIAPIRDFLAAP